MQFRKYANSVENILTGIAVVMVVYHVLYVAQVFEWLDIYIDPAVHMAAHLCFLLPLVFLLVPATKKGLSIPRPMPIKINGMMGTLFSRKVCHKSSYGPSPAKRDTSQDPG